MAPKAKAASSLQPVLLEGVRIIFRNFSGAAQRYNAKGRRNFNVLLDQETAKRMSDDGFNVRYLTSREEGEADQPVLKVNVRYSEDKRPPRVILITSRGKTVLDEDTISVLDYAEIMNVDLIFRPYEREVDGVRTVTAYLQSIYVTIREDELEMKYMDVPHDSAILRSREEEEPPF